jgi:hypothetical protein
MRKKKKKTYERAPWRGVSSWSSFHPTRVAREAGAGGGVVPVVRRVSSTVVRRVLSPVIRRRSTRDPPHEQLLVRLGRVVHRRMLSIVVVPGRLSFPHRLSSVVPLVVRCRRCRTALVHPQSTQRAVARQRGGGCSVDRRRRPRRRCSSSSSLFVAVPVRRRRPCSSSSSPSSSFVVRRHRHSSFIVIVIRRSSSSSFVVHRHRHSSFVVIVPVVVIRRSSSFVRPSPFLVHPSFVLRRLSSIPLFHPQSTPRAVAREAGGRWRCRHRGWWR